jgi:Tol biopolymer transport system component
VRVEARRLRSKLEEYYRVEGQRNSLRITVPKGGYAAVFEPRRAPETAAAPTHGGRQKWIVGAAAIAILLSLAAMRGFPVSPHPPDVSTLISLGGSINGVSLSPDGGQALYSFTQEGEKPKVYVKTVGTAPPRRLTDDPDPQHNEYEPRWIPDGSGVSFIRRIEASPLMPTAGTLFAVPTTGGRPRKLIDIGECRGYSWMPAGKSLVISLRDPEGAFSLYSVAVTGERVRLSNPPALRPNTGNIPDGDEQPRVSPDGKRIAFLRSLPNGSALMVMLTAGGEPVRLARELTNFLGFAWTADSREIVFSAKGDGAPSNLLYRARAAGGEPTPVSFVAPGMNPLSVAISDGGSLVYTLSGARMAIWRYRLPVAGGTPYPPVRVADSPRTQISPAFAPDGTQFAFISTRTGNYELYIADREGKQPVQLTSFGRGMTGWPRWSPDGRRIAIDARPNNRSRIYLVDPEGGAPQPLTGGLDDAVMPEWSADGQWIYYTRMDASGHSSIWKIRPSGGEEVGVSNGEQWLAFPSPDGKVLFTAKRGRLGIYSMPMDGGPESLAAPEVFYGMLARARSGFYYIAQGRGSSLRQLMHYSYSSGRSEPVMTFPRPAGGAALAISPDESEALLSQNEGATGQIMLVKNFR